MKGATHSIPFHYINRRPRIQGLSEWAMECRPPLCLRICDKSIGADYPVPVDMLSKVAPESLQKYNNSRVEIMSEWSNGETEGANRTRGEFFASWDQVGGHRWIDSSDITWYRVLPERGEPVEMARRRSPGWCRVNIAIVIYKYWPDRGGVENYCKLLVEAFLERGHEVEIFCARRRNVGDIEKHVKFHRVPILRGNTALHAWSFANNAARAVRGQGYDIVQSLARCLWQDVYRLGGGLHRMFLRESLRGRSKLAAVGKMLRPYHWTVMHVENRVFEEHLYRHIVTNSRMVKGEVMDLFGVPSEEITVIYNGVDLERFSPSNRDRYRSSVRDKLGIDRDERVALLIATSFRRKGLAEIIAALGQVSPQERFRLVVAGGGDPSRYLHQARRAGVNVDFLGRQSQVERLYAASDVFVLPTAYDPFANVTIEAMSSGIPVITTAQNGASEIITSAHDGYVVANQADVTGIVQALENLADLSHRSVVAERARARAEQFSYRKNAEQTLALYGTLLNG